MKADCIYEREADHADYLYFRHSFGDNCCAHFHLTTEFFFVKSGRAEVFVNGVSKVLEAGEIAVVPSYHVHHYRCGEENEVYVMLISQNLLRRFFSMHGGIFRSFLPVSEITPEVFDWLEVMRVKWQDADALMRYGLATYLLGLLATVYPADRRPDAKDAAAAQILRYIDEHAAEPLTLEGLAKEFGYCKNYFSSMFNRVTGMHLKEYLNRARLRLVRERIEKNDGKDTVLEIATECGFNSLSSYYRALKDSEKQIR